MNPHRLPSSSVRINQFEKLVSYFTQVMPVVSGGSTFGRQLEQAARVAYGCRMCQMCGGDPGTGRPGCGFVIAGEEGATEKERAQSRHRRKPNDLERALMEHFGEALDEPENLELDPRRDAVCPNCGGNGFIPRSSRAKSRAPIDARPHKADTMMRGAGGSKPPTIGNGGGYYIAENMAPMCGSVGAYLAELRRGDEVVGTRHALVLEIYIEHRSEVPLWLLTPPGLTLVKRGGVIVQWARTLEQLLTALDNERSAQQDSPDYQRGRLIETASRQAHDLLEEAADCWNEVAPAHEDEETEQEYLEAVGL